MNIIDKIKSNWMIIFLQEAEDDLFRRLTGAQPLKISQITTELFVGPQYNLFGLKKLHLLGITAIVNMRETLVYNESRYQDFKYLHLPTEDNTAPSMADLIKGAAFTDNEIRVNHGKVYIHCRQGIGRGPAMTIAYLISTGITYEEGFALVKKARPFISLTAVQKDRLNELEGYYRHAGQAGN